MNDDAEPAPADSPREPAAADAPSAPATRDPDAENAAAVADAVRAAAALDAAEAEAPAALPRAQLAHVPPPERVPIRYLVSMVAAVWIGAALLYLISKLGLPTTRSRIAMVCTVMLDLFPLLRSRAFRTWLWDVTFGQWPKIDAETVRTPAEAGTFSWRVLGIMVLVAVSLTLQEYIGDRSYFEHLFPVTPWQHYKLGALAWPGSWGVQSPMRYYHELAGFAWWSGWRVLGYIVMPVMFILAWPGYRLRDVHIRFDGFFRHLWIYVFLFALVLPAVLYASTTPAFRHTYPFYRLANRSRVDLWTWEGLYSAQFVALEFFFRGFILQGLRKVMGANAVFVMIVPYCMIHYGKPLPETLGAIGAGLILGTLALRTRSIWGGVLIHIGVALTMDVLALQGCPKSPGGWCSE